MMIEAQHRTTHGVMAYRHYTTHADNRTLLCIHGYDRTSRDFSRLAEALHDRWNVLCPDLFGRGRSQWLEDKLQYHPGTYARAVRELLEHLGIESFDCLGTSMGGHVALLVASSHAGALSLTINDIGPFSDVASFRALAKGFRARRCHFESLEDAADYMRTLNKAFALRTDEDWRLCALNCMRAEGDGRYCADYDPELPQPQESPTVQDRDLWHEWRTLRCPALVIRGAKSRVLPREMAEQMIASRPGTKLVEISECGHAPMFYDPAQIAVVGTWLESRSVPNNHAVTASA